MPLSPVVLIVLDGLRYDTARENLAFLEGLVRAGRADVHGIDCELPAISRPLYETILTGRTPADHGIASNAIVRRSQGDNLFALVRKAGGKTAAAAYHWVSELYVSAPFDPVRDRLLLDGDGDIQSGVFYWDDAYPDSHLFADAAALIARDKPDFLLLHPMNVDDTGHKHGGTSIAYRQAARLQSDLIARHVPDWIERGYTVLVTADHGMSEEGDHCGPAHDECHVPFYALGLKLDPAPRQIEIAGLICRLMDVDPETMPTYGGRIER